MLVLMIHVSWSSSNMGHVGSKTRSLGQIVQSIVRPLEVTVCTSIFIIFHQNVSLGGDILVKFEHGSCWVSYR